MTCRYAAFALLLGCQSQELVAPPPSIAAEPSVKPASAPPTRPGPRASAARYKWLDSPAPREALEARFSAPAGFARVPLEEASFGAFLRQLPMRPRHSPVRSYTGRVLREPDHPGVAAVVEMDVGERDLQQCADVVMRLHAEWLLSRQRPEAIRYHASSGQLMAWSRWAAGERGRLEGTRLAFSIAARPDDSRRTFRSYLDFVFGWAGTASLARYSSSVERDAVAPGDFFVLPGNPGHTVLVLDIAKNERGQRVALLGQSFMPAQDFQVLRDHQGAWFDLDAAAIATPFWPAPFPWSSLHRLPDE